MSVSKKIKFIYDEEGNTTDVQMPIESYERIIDKLEELEDIADVEKRRNEEEISLSELKKHRQKKHG